MSWIFKFLFWVGKLWKIFKLIVIGLELFNLFKILISVGLDSDFVFGFYFFFFWYWIFFGVIVIISKCLFGFLFCCYCIIWLKVCSLNCCFIGVIIIIGVVISIFISNVVNRLNFFCEVDFWEGRSWSIVNNVEINVIICLIIVSYFIIF